jgi:hypothetical protein
VYDFGEDAEAARSADKINAVARLWAARGGTAFVPPAVAPSTPPPSIEEEESVMAMELFEALMTQLLRDGMGYVDGIDHTTLEWEMEIRGIRDPDEQYVVRRRFGLIEREFVKSCRRKSKTD